MRILEINGTKVDIDEKTAIGIDFSGYDISKPGERKVASSNNFSIPKTAKNMAVFGWPGNPQSLSTIPYDSLSCNYWINNIKLINDGRAILSNVKDRIYLDITEKSNIWDTLDSTLISEFIPTIISELGLPDGTTPYVGSFSVFIDYILANFPIRIPLYFGNLANYDPGTGTGILENSTRIYLEYIYQVGGNNIHANGAHFCITAKSLFEIIESYFEVDFGTADSDAYQIFNDTYGEAIYLPLPNLDLDHTATAYYFAFDDDTKFEPHDIEIAFEGKSLGDFVRAYFQLFNVIIDKTSTGFICHRLDDLDNAPEEDFSGIQIEPEFMPKLDGYKQYNYIKFKTIYEGAPNNLGAKEIVCLNKNIEAGTSDESLFEIDAHMPGTFVNPVQDILDMSTPEALNNFTFMIDSGYSQSIDIKYTSTVAGSPVNDSYTKTIPIAAVYGLTGEYNLIASMVEYPKKYVIEKYLKLIDIYNLKYFVKRWVKELNGYFFVNKITGVNPDKSNEPVKIELIKIP